MPKCADCGTEGATSDSPKQQVEGTPIEKQVPQAMPRALCKTCMATAYSKEYGQSQSGGEAPARANVGDVPAAPRTSG